MRSSKLPTFEPATLLPPSGLEFRAAPRLPNAGFSDKVFTRREVVDVSGAKGAVRSELSAFISAEANRRNASAVEFRHAPEIAVHDIGNGVFNVSIYSRQRFVQENNNG